VRRREFITLLGGAAAAWPVAARGQQNERVRRIGVLLGGVADDPENKTYVAAFRQGLERLGWIEGRNIHVDYRHAAGRLDNIPALAKELIALRPEVVVSQGTPITAVVQRESRDIPIVFLTVSDPIGSGYVTSLARPGGNLTGLMMYEAGIVGKWLGMLKEVAPQLTRAAMLASPSTVYDYFLQAATVAAPQVGVELSGFKVANDADIERAFASIAATQNIGLVLPPDNITQVHRDLVNSLAARHRLPAVYGLRVFVAAGGLMSYGTVLADVYRNTAFYVDRILKGAKPADLPVQAPTKYETVINQKTAKALGFVMPPGMLVAADEVIE
jgi:putative ABC transport system substrate-binding protein